MIMHRCPLLTCFDFLQLPKWYFNVFHSQMFAQLAMDIPSHMCVSIRSQKASKSSNHSSAITNRRRHGKMGWTNEFEFTEGSGIPDRQHS